MLRGRRSDFLDERAVELTGDPDALISALTRLANSEGMPSRSWLGRRRFSLFVAASVEDGYWMWLARQRATHP